MMKLIKSEHAIVQAIRFSPENLNPSDGIFESAASKAYSTISSGDYYNFQFACLDVSGILQPCDILAPNKFKDIKVSSCSLDSLDRAFNKIKMKWVFLSGSYVRQSFDLSDDTNGKSHYLFGLTLSQLLGGFNKSESGDLWIHPDNRAIFKDFKDVLQLIFFNCYVGRGYGNEGYCYYQNITLDFNKHKYSTSSAKKANIKSESYRGLSLDEARRIIEIERCNGYKVKTAEISIEDSTDAR